ncbi:MAG: glycosyltransferase family 2 protein [Verrucomicrobiales bacterium]
MKITLGIIAFNEEKNLGRCLESACEVADEILVLDSGSRDRTTDIARKHGARVEHQPWLGYVGQKNKLLDLATHPWILSLDADEALSPALLETLLQIKNSEPSQGISGYSMPRCVFYEGRWIRHGDWYPDRLTRLFRREQGRFAGGKVHERLELNGKVHALHEEIYHYSFEDASDHWNRCVKYAHLWAESAHEKGKHGGSLIGAARASHRFIRSYLLKRGFMEGRLGFPIAFFSARQVFLKYKRLGQLKKNNP